MKLCANASVKQLTAALLAAYTDALSTGAKPPSADDVFTTRPSSPVASMRGTNASVHIATPSTLTEWHQRQSFGSCSHGSPPPPDVTPALLHSTLHVP